MKKLVLIILILTSFTTFAQTFLKNPDYVLWSETRKLQVSDFQLKRKHNEGNVPVYLYLAVGFEFKSSFELVGKKANQKVYNYVQKSVSWIDTTDIAPEILLKVAQTEFDIQEIYTRKMRKFIRDNRNKILWKTSMTGNNELDAKLKELHAESNKMQLEWADETDYGRLTVKQVMWETKIKFLLGELSEFAVEFFKSTD